MLSHIPYCTIVIIAIKTDYWQNWLTTQPYSTHRHTPGCTDAGQRSKPVRAIQMMAHMHVAGDRSEYVLWSTLRTAIKTMGLYSMYVLYVLHFIHGVEHLCFYIPSHVTYLLVTTYCSQFNV